MRGADRAALFANNLDDRSGRGSIAFYNVTRENPRVPGPDAVRAFAIHLYYGQLTDRLKPRNALFGRRMSGKHPQQRLAGERLDDEHMGGRGRRILL